jgi:hypothetical protein
MAQFPALEARGFKQDTVIDENTQDYSFVLARSRDATLRVFALLDYVCSVSFARRIGAQRESNPARDAFHRFDICDGLREGS